MANLTRSCSPYVKSNITTKRIMIDVCIALCPSCIAGCVFFGLHALLLLAVASLSAVLTEFCYCLCSKKTLKETLSQFDFSSLVTGMLVGMNLYGDSKVYVAVLCSVFAVAVVKMIFGGTGKNVVNPAAAGRIFGFISFGAGLGGTVNLANRISSLSFGKCVTYTLIDGSTVTTGATPLAGIYHPMIDGYGTMNTLSNLDMALGFGVSGTIGEVCKIALILGGIYLVIRKVLDFRWPLVYLAVTGLVTVCLNGFDFELFLPSILSGGLMLGAIFMATDYVTSPHGKLGRYVYYVCLGILTAVMRQAVGGEVVSFCILIMNLFVPFIDRYLFPRPFGYVKEEQK